MPDDTTILSLPLILPAQAQKHVTHNEALVALDLIVQLAVINRTLTTPPPLPTIGDRHIVAAGAAGPWVGQTGRIALFTEAGWQFTVPLPGWQAYVMAESQMAFFNGLAWIALSDGPFTVGQLGVSATADATNRLTVSSPATLLNHAGAGHQLKLNKAAAAETASLLFQTGFSGRAEMGTAGSDDFSVKVSADGATFFTALEAEAATGEVTLPQPVHLGGQLSDPVAPPDGTLWLNLTTGDVKVRSAGVTQVVGGGGGVTDGDKGDITVSGSGATWTIDAGAVDLSKLADLANATIIGRASAGTGVPEALSAAQVRTILNVANGATANAADAALLSRANHTGTQGAATITGLAAVATSGSASDLGAGTLPAARLPAFGSGDVSFAASGGAGTVANNAVTNAKAADMAANTIKANATAATADPADLSVGTNTVVGRVAGNIVAAQVVTAQIADNAVDNAKVADMATATLKGRVTAGTGNPEDLTGTQATTLLDTFTATLKGLAPASGGGTTNFLRADGSWAAPAGGGGVTDGDKGDITVTGGGATWTIDNGVVALAKLADLATARFIGRTTAGTGAPEALTGTQATALLDTFTSGAKGLAPASGGGTANFLRADGTWAAPSGGGGGTPGGVSGEIQFNNAGAFGGAADVEIEGGQLRLPSISTPTAPSTGGIKLFARNLGGRLIPAYVGPTSQDAHPLQPFLGEGNYMLFLPGAGTTITSIGMVPTGTGTATAANVTNGSRRNRMKRIEYLVTTASTTAVAGLYHNGAQLTIGGGNAWEGGFWGQMHGGPSTGVTNASHRFFMGLRDNGGPADTDPSTFLRCVGIGYAAADTNVQFMHNDASGVVTKIDLGASFPKPNADRAFTYRLRLYSPPGPTQSVTYEVTYLETGATATGTVTTNIPATTDFITPRIQQSVGGVSSVVGCAVGPISFQTED